MDDALAQLLKSKFGVFCIVLILVVMDDALARLISNSRAFTAES